MDEMYPADNATETDGAESGTRLTLSTQIYQQLRADIISGAIAPGTKLKIHSIAQRFDVGLSPAREALNRLTSQRLVVQSERRGFSVATVSEDELADLTRVRCWLNEIALRESMRLGDRDWENRVLSAYFVLSRTPRDDDTTSGKWNKAHQAFHEALLDACGSKYLIEYCRDLFLAAERYRHLGVLVADSLRSDTDREHREIMQATLDRDMDQAVAHLRAHYEKTQAHLRLLLERFSPTGIERADD